MHTDEKNELVRKILQVCAACPKFKADAERSNLNKELAEELTENIKRKFPNLNFRAKEICSITTITLFTLAGDLRQRNTFNGARILEYAGKCVLREKNAK